MPLGMATRKVRSEKTNCAVSVSPATNIWCPQTRYPMKAMARLEMATALYPNTVLCENVLTISETTPIGGRIMM